ncbi:response regulator [Paracidobacterium acidisoli]|uniref:Response regulator n=1 Tax=Paracidobacterium acidisoli TaxID=2303751 RepID=A0A372ITB2_9BACT|nr:response regulator [Paracidobacterium acidisoli]MBT9329565.1 response regulator [Paracidobacterium acidisoli]
MNTRTMETPGLQSLHRSLVLLVDDNHTHQYSLGRHLHESGFDVIHAHTGAETLSLVSVRQPDVILLDIHLPDTTGFDICQRLKENPETESIPVVFHSATYDTQAAKSQATDLGAVSFLSYPIDIEHLVSVLRGATVRAQANRKA